jgi:hypothetical protein
VSPFPLVGPSQYTRKINTTVKNNNDDPLSN